MASRIAFSSNRTGGSGDFEIFAMGAPNGNSQNRLTNRAGADSEPLWLSSSSIVFVSSTGLFTVGPTGGAVTQVPGTQPGSTSPG